MVSFHPAEAPLRELLKCLEGKSKKPQKTLEM